MSRPSTAAYSRGGAIEYLDGFRVMTLPSPHTPSNSSDFYFLDSSLETEYGWKKGSICRLICVHLLVLIGCVM